MNIAVWIIQRFRGIHTLTRHAHGPNVVETIFVSRNIKNLDI